MSSYNDFDHQGSDYYSQPRGFLTPPPAWRTRRCSPAMPASERKPGRSSPQPKGDLFHVIHKVPSGNSPYVRAKHVQLIDKDPSKAISLFWAAINSGDRVDSALKDMAVVMKQLDRSDEAIEAIKSFRHLCPPDSQESLDNILLELYKQSGRTEEEIQMLQIKLKRVEEGVAFGRKRTKVARSQGKKVQVTVEKEYSRLLGNLAWAYMQQKNFKSAEENYRKALSFESDKNKLCNLAICLMHLNKLTEARFLLQAIRVSSENGGCMDESYAKSYDRASQMLAEFESQQGHANKTKQTKPFCGHLDNPLYNAKDDGLQSSSPLPSTTDKMNNTEFPYEKWADFDRRRNDRKPHTGQEACKIAYESPFLGRATLEVPFTQPRRCLPPGGQSKSRLTETFCRKLTFGSFMGSEHARTMKKSEKGMNLDTPSDLASSDATENGKSDLKMSWADMVEEDEKKFGKWRKSAWTKSAADQLSFGMPDQERFSDENRDSNIILKTPIQFSIDRAEIDIGSGYLTQPEKAATLSTNQTIRRSLYFDQSRQLGSESNNSPLSTKVLDFEDNGLLLLSPDFGSDKSMKRRNRLKVFQDITTQKD